MIRRLRPRRRQLRIWLQYKNSVFLLQPGGRRKLRGGREEEEEEEEEGGWEHLLLQQRLRVHPVTRDNNYLPRSERL